MDPLSCVHPDPLVEGVQVELGSGLHGPGSDGQRGVGVGARAGSVMGPHLVLVFVACREGGCKM